MVVLIVETTLPDETPMGFLHSKTAHESNRDGNCTVKMICMQGAPANYYRSYQTGSFSGKNVSWCSTPFDVHILRIVVITMGCWRNNLTPYLIACCCRNLQFEKLFMNSLMDTWFSCYEKSNYVDDEYDCQPSEVGIEL